jgi:hypothetical protein
VVQRHADHDQSAADIQFRESRWSILALNGLAADRRAVNQIPGAEISLID